MVLRAVATVTCLLQGYDLVSARNYLQWHALPEGRCLDGTPAGYYLEDTWYPEERREKLKKGVLVYFQGGGWCEGDTAEETLHDCERRARGRLGSSKYYRREIDRSWYLDEISKEFLLIYVPYCDGTSFTGNATVSLEGSATVSMESGNHVRTDITAAGYPKTLHFEGYLILNELLGALKNEFQKTPPSRFIISGGSAGGSTVFYHLDHIAQRIQADFSKGEFGKEISKRIPVLGLPDAGYFIKGRSIDGRDLWPHQMAILWEVSRGYSNLHKGCLERFPEKPDRCLYQENYDDLIETPLFMVQSKYDASEIGATLGVSCNLDKRCPGLLRRKGSCCSERALDAVKNLWTAHKKVSKGIFAPNSIHGYWLIDCIIHTVFGLRKSERTTIPVTVQGDTDDGKTTSARRTIRLSAEEAAMRWLLSDGKDQSIKLIDERSWKVDDKRKYCKDPLKDVGRKKDDYEFGVVDDSRRVDDYEDETIDDVKLVGDLNRNAVENKDLAHEGTIVETKNTYSPFISE